MKVALIYIFPNLKLPVYQPLAQRFAQSYLEFPPGQQDHEIHVFVNNGPASAKQQKLFEPLPCHFHSHNNYGKDIGAYMVASITLPCDLMICCGSHIHFHRGGWLDRMVDVYLANGPGLYGCWGFHQPAPHIRTTIFWCPPMLLSSYPYSVANPYRYNFEHGPKESILRWTIKLGLPVGMVGWTMFGPYPNFRHLGPSESLVHDQHIDRSLPKPKPAVAPPARVLQTR